jgi:signal transduction histidine kinase
MKNESVAYKVGYWGSGPGRVVLYGFLLVRDGVPFLPHHNTVALGLTVLAGLIASIPPPERGQWRARLSVASVITVFVILNVVLHLDRPTTSMVLVGAFVLTLSRFADNYPFVYGLVAGIGVSGAVAQAFDLHPATRVPQTMLSGRPWTPDAAGHEMMLLAGFVLLSAVANAQRQRTEALKKEKAAAEAARDAAVSDERARIARELHDVVSHHVTAMTLQAEAAAMTGDKAALTAVAAEGRDALTELRRMLGVLRRPDDGAPSSLTPQPDLDALDELASRARSGVAVRIERRGDVRPLPAGLELGAYRLVQEALTNSSKHGDATTVEVMLTYGANELRVDIVDNGRPLAAARVGSAGLGLVGMTERVALLNGTLETGPRSDAAGYGVHAVLPVGA